jgi:hypothetical protein
LSQREPEEGRVYNVGMVRAKITRREWAAVLASAATPALAQTRTPAQLQSQAAAEIRRDLETLRKFPLSLAVEPATIFQP